MSKRVNSGIIVIGVIVVILMISNAVWCKTATKYAEVKATASAKAAEMEELTKTFKGLQERIESDKEFEKEYNTFINELQEKRDNIDKKYTKLETIEETEEYIKEVKGLEEDYLNWCKEKGITE